MRQLNQLPLFSAVRMQHSWGRPAANLLVTPFFEPAIAHRQGRHNSTKTFGTSLPQQPSLIQNIEGGLRRTQIGPRVRTRSPAATAENIMLSLTVRRIVAWRTGFVGNTILHPVFGHRGEVGTEQTTGDGPYSLKEKDGPHDRQAASTFEYSTKWLCRHFMKQLPAVKNDLTLNNIRQLITWHIPLNYHTSMRLKNIGGSRVPSVTDCKVCTQLQPGIASSSWRCDLDLPNSSALHNGLRLQVSGQASTDKGTSEIACLGAVASLLITNPSEVLPRQKHWKIPLHALLAGLLQADAVHQALPVHVHGATRNNDAAHARVSPAEVACEASSIIRRGLNAHGAVEAPGFASATGSASTQESPKVTTAPLDIFPFYS